MAKIPKTDIPPVNDNRNAEITGITPSTKLLKLSFITFLFIIPKITFARTFAEAAMRAHFIEPLPVKIRYDLIKFIFFPPQISASRRLTVEEWDVRTRRTVPQISERFPRAQVPQKPFCLRCATA